MKKMFLLFSHTLSDEQKNDAIKNLNVNEFVYMNTDLQSIWSNISPEIETLDNVMQPFKDYLKDEAQKDDIVLIQGDFGAVYQMVNYAKSISLTPIYATTKRVVHEVKLDGKCVKKSIFEHIRYREYI